MRYLLLLIIVGLMIPVVSAADPSYYKIDEVVEVKVPCINNGTYCSGGAYCNLTVIDPLTTTIVQNQPMTGSSGLYNYTLSTDDTNTVGEYQATVVCQDDKVKGVSTYSFFVTNENINFSNLLPLIIGIGILMFYLLYFAINLKDAHPLLSLILVSISISLTPILSGALIWSDNMMYRFYQASWWVVVLFFTYAIFYFLWEVYFKYKLGWDGRG